MPALCPLELVGTSKLGALWTHGGREKTKRRQNYDGRLQISDKDKVEIESLLATNNGLQMFLKV